MTNLPPAKAADRAPRPRLNVSRWLLLAGLACGLGTTQAQVTAELSFEQDQHLVGETLVVSVRITNFSGRSLKLGEDDTWLQFSIEPLSGGVVPRLAPPPVRLPFELPSASVATRRVDLAPCFEFSRPGRFSVRATIRVDELAQVLTTPAEGFTLIAGAKEWEQEFGVPGGDPDEIEVRKYSLIQATRGKRQELYVRVSDREENRTYRVFPIGPLVSFSRPSPILDRAGRLHVLFQTGARVFNYAVVNPQGELLVRQMHTFTSTRPGLRVDDAGNVTVVGGARRVTPADLPPPEPPAASPPPTEPPVQPLELKPADDAKGAPGTR